MSKLDVTVVIPTRNRISLLRTTLRSVLDQRAVDLEVVVVDEASDDGTSSLPAELGDPRVRVLRNDEPLGVARARNRGIDAANAPWVALLDDDDVWAPTKLATQLRAAVAEDAGWAYSGAVAVDDDLRVVERYETMAADLLREELPRRNPVPAGSSNVLVQRALFDQTGTFDANLMHLADWDMWRRLAERARPAAVDEPLVGYRLHHGNKSRETAGILEEARSIEAASGREIDWVAIHRWMATNHLRQGDRLRAARSFLLAARRGDRRSLARAANALVVRDPAARHHHRPFRARHLIDDPWAAAAEAWLAPLRAGPPQPDAAR